MIWVKLFCLEPRVFVRGVRELVHCVLHLCSSVCVWDLGAPRIAKTTEEKNLSGIPTTFKHLDLTWKPHLKVGFFYLFAEESCRFLWGFSKQFKFLSPATAE